MWATLGVDEGAIEGTDLAWSRGTILGVDGGLNESIDDPFDRRREEEPKERRRKPCQRMHGLCNLVCVCAWDQAGRYSHQSL